MEGTAAVCEGWKGIEVCRVEGNEEGKKRQCKEQQAG